MDHKLLQELTQAVEKATSEVLEKNNLPYASVSCHWQIPGLDKFGSIFAVSGTQEIAKPAGSGGLAAAIMKMMAVAVGELNSNIKVAEAAFFTHRLDRRNGGFLLEIDNE